MPLNRKYPPILPHVGEEERLRQLFENSPGFMGVVTGPEHVFEMANSAFHLLVGLQSLTGRSAKQAFAGVAGEDFLQLLDQVREGAEPITGRRQRLRFLDEPGDAGEERYIDFVLQPILGDDGRVSGIFVQGHDVTDYHLAELALRESEERFRLIADSAPVPMWVTKLDRKRNFVNRAYVEFLGISYEEAVDFDWRTVIHPDDRERILQESMQGEASLEKFVLEARYRSADGWRWIRSVSQPRWGPGGEHIGFIGIAHDITDSKEAESALREMNETLEKRVAERTVDLTAALERLQSEVGERLRAEDALRQAQKMEAVGRLTGGIAHDFNNLLTPVIGGLEIISMRTTDERLKRVATTALESAQRGAKLTSQLLAFSRIQRISMEPILVNEVIVNMKDLLRHTIGKDIRIATKLSEEPLSGVCDANQLENAILNLALNARDAMPAGGILTIATSRTQLGAGPDIVAGEYVCVSVADTGEGMAPEILARATEPFFSTKPIGKGTGLGLAQVYGIARQSGGTLRLESEVGKGSRIGLFIPAASAEGERADLDHKGTGKAAPVETKGAASILVVDDDPDVRDFLTASLQDLGHKVATADCGRAGLEELARRQPDLVLLDYAMPDLNGADVAREARRLCPELPIVFVTGFAESDKIEAVLGSDVPLLRKPFSMAQLETIIAETLAQEPQS